MWYLQTLRFPRFSTMSVRCRATRGEVLGASHANITELREGQAVVGKQTALEHREEH
jgi:hypothetical protein